MKRGKNSLSKKGVAVKESILCKPLSKKAVAVEELIWWTIAIAVLAIIILGTWALKNKGTSALDYIKQIFRFKP